MASCQQYLISRFAVCNWLVPACRPAGFHQQYLVWGHTYFFPYGAFLLLCPCSIPSFWLLWFVGRLKKIKYLLEVYLHPSTKPAASGGQYLWRKNPNQLRPGGTPLQLTCNHHYKDIINFLTVPRFCPKIFLEGAKKLIDNYLSNIFSDGCGQFCNT